MALPCAPATSGAGGGDSVVVVVVVCGDAAETIRNSRWNRAVQRSLGDNNNAPYRSLGTFPTCRENMNAAGQLFSSISSTGRGHFFAELKVAKLNSCGTTANRPHSPYVPGLDVAFCP